MQNIPPLPNVRIDASMAPGSASADTSPQRSIFELQPGRATIRACAVKAYPRMAKSDDTLNMATGKTTIAHTQLVLPAGPEKMPIKAMPVRMRAVAVVILLSDDPHGAANLASASIVFSLLSAHMFQQMHDACIHYLQHQSRLEPKPKNKYRKHGQHEPFTHVDIGKPAAALLPMMAV